MNISQHAFCPLGFISGYTYDDTMKLICHSRFTTSILSPSYGHSFIEFAALSRETNVRFWSPLLKSNDIFISNINLSSVFLFARSYAFSSYNLVTCLNF